jgi:hypothetical protein
MKSLLNIFETYLLVLVHPYRIHQSLRHGLPLINHTFSVKSLNLSEAIGISWIFSIVKGFTKLTILNVFLLAFWSLHTEDFPIISDILQGAGFTSYYFFLFTITLDIIFFPILAFVSTEIWSWVIKLFTHFLNKDLPAEKIADQITTHALSSYLFSIIPVIGDFIQTIVYYFLLYTGLRANLEASRPLALIILISPLLIIFMILAILSLALFYFI